MRCVRRLGAGEAPKQHQAQDGRPARPAARHHVRPLMPAPPPGAAPSPDRFAAPALSLANSPPHSARGSRAQHAVLSSRGLQTPSSARSKPHASDSTLLTIHATMVAAALRQVGAGGFSSCRSATSGARLARSLPGTLPRNPGAVCASADGGLSRRAGRSLRGARARDDNRGIAGRQAPLLGRARGSRAPHQQ